MDGDQIKQPDCPGCAKYAERIAELEERLNKLDAELAKARKHSGNSSKPPSSDIVSAGKDKKRKNRKGSGRRKRGGQPGHPRHERTPFAADQIDATWLHYYEGCPCCGGEMVDTDAPVKVLQQVELKQLPLVISEHQRSTQRCTRCQKEHCVPWPEDLRRAGLVGPRLTAFIGYLKSACHMSYSSIRKFMRDVVGVKISNGQLRKLVAKVTNSIAEPSEELLTLLASCRFIHHFESYFRFFTTQGIEPTNNLAEQAIRFGAIHRRITQGTRSPAGQTWCERIWTIIATCEQQGRSLFAYLCDTVEKYLAGRPVPSLAPSVDSS